MNANFRKSVPMILAAALVAGVAFQAPAFAGDSSLSINEQSAQAAIAGVAPHAKSPSGADIGNATLATNEASAQRAIVDVATPLRRHDEIAVATTLAQNELAAQHAIVDAKDSQPALYSGDATATVTSLHTPIQH
jgi:hypothetical protein